MDSEFGDPPEEELPYLPLEQSFVAGQASNTENSTHSDELFSCFISTLTDSQSNSGVQIKESYQCRRCGKHFGRLDHVKRHCRSREFWFLFAVDPILVRFRTIGELMNPPRCERAYLPMQAVLERLQSKVTSSNIRRPSVQVNGLFS